MTQQPNQLHLQLAQRILTHARLSRFEPGHHLTETSLQEVLGTSRGPIRAALAHLARQKVLEKRPNKGFFLVRAPGNLHKSNGLPAAEDEKIYLSIAADRLTHELPESVTENELMRRYELPRPRLRRILDRIASEGWAQRRTGHGWTFQPLIDSVEAYRENYELRIILEPAGILSPSFKLDFAEIERLKRQQEFVHSEGYNSLSQTELFEVNAQFHETIAAMSGNRFLAQTIARLNQLRRLIEYRQTLDRSRVHRQTGEHLAIIKLLESKKHKSAAKMMHRHLGGAEREKAKTYFFRAQQAEA
jgi:DNA-binding GntR family transcriptional regulator